MLKMIGKLLSLLARVDLNSINYSTNVSSFPATTDFGMVQIQLQDSTGNWRTYHVTNNIPAMIISGMRQLKGQYPDHRVRAVNENGSLVDIL